MHTPKEIADIQIILIIITSKNKILRNKFKEYVEISMYENIQDIHERNV